MTSIVFMGTSEFSVPILEGLLADPHYEVLAVVTQPDRPVGRKKVLTPTPVKKAALAHNLKILQPEKLSGSPEMAEIIALAPDLLITAAFGQFLPSKLLQAARIRALNVHASLLPKYRGGAPIHYAVMNGDEKTGVTIMEMIKKMDAGGIFTQKAIPILPTDDTGLLFEKLSIVGRDLLLETLPKILGGLAPVPQEESAVTFSPNITKEQEQLDFTLPATAVFNKIRGLRPFPGAYGILNGTRFKIWNSMVLDETTDATPGTIIALHPELKVACGQQSVLGLKVVQPAGKKAMSVSDYLNGSGQELTVGTRLQ